MPPSLSLQNQTVRGRKRPFSDILKKGKEKAPRVVSWDKNIVCLPEDYCRNSRIISIPKGKQRSSLAARGLCGKIRINSEMTEEEILGEIRSAFQEAMGNDRNFPFQFLQMAGGGSKSLTIPVLSASYTWTAKEVAKMAGQGCLYIQAKAPLKEYSCDSNTDIDLTQDQVGMNVHNHYVFIYGTQSVNQMCIIKSWLSCMKAAFCLCSWYEHNIIICTACMTFKLQIALECSLCPG
jgi:hypothetical protein